MRNELLVRATDRENARLRRVDDRREAVDAPVHSEVGDGEGAALELLRLELALAGACRQLVDLGVDRGKALKSRS